MYYEIDSTSNIQPDWRTGWSGYMVEADTVGMLHFHHYYFKFSDWLGKKIFIDQHYHYEMPVLDFFNCRSKSFYPLRRPDQLKGIMVVYPEKNEKNGQVVTFVFVDVFYFVCTGDLLMSGFNLYDPELKKRAFDLDFEGDYKLQIIIERVSMKFVKHLFVGGRSQPIFTFHISESYEIAKFSVKERLILRGSKVRAYICSQSAISIGSAVICFYKRVKQPKSRRFAKENCSPMTSYE